MIYLSVSLFYYHPYHEQSCV
uniref:Uncharacterized protein n=1 Tax=Rhizophora mucronata TaxID=61149 RepID=A0A2P2PN29_RHIMU